MRPLGTSYSVMTGMPPSAMTGCSGFHGCTDGALTVEEYASSVRMGRLAEWRACSAEADGTCFWKPVLKAWEDCEAVTCPCSHVGGLQALAHVIDPATTVAALVVAGIVTAAEATTLTGARLTKPVLVLTVSIRVAAMDSATGAAPRLCDSNLSKATRPAPATPTLW